MPPTGASLRTEGFKINFSSPAITGINLSIEAVALKLPLLYNSLVETYG